MNIGNKPCTRCLLEAAGRIDVKAQVAAQLARLKAEDRADEALYKERLDYCMQCANLSQGTCLKCGCYVELRAAVKKNHCPDSRKKW